MPVLANSLSAIEIKRMIKPGLHAVGAVPGVRLQIKTSGAKSWILRSMVGPRRVELGLGGYPAVTLAQATELARESLHQIQIRAGTDPLAQRHAKRAVIAWTFLRTAEAYIEAHKTNWKNAKHLSQWENTPAAYVFPTIGANHVRDVIKADVLNIFEPCWSTKNETMVRTRNS